MNKQNITMFLVDVETTFDTPTPYSGYMTEFGAVEFNSGKTFHGIIYETTMESQEPPIFVIKEDGDHNNLEDVMKEFNAWIESFEYDRNIFVSDNPAFDFMWIADAFDKSGLKNPFGHSGRRIGDLYAGLSGKWKNQSGWKKYRKTPHDHNPVNDACGNREALIKILEKYNQSF